MTIRDIYASDIIKAIRVLCIEANYYLSDDVKNRIKKAYAEENWPIAKDILEKIMENLIA